MPDIVWFREIPKYLNEIDGTVSSATLFVSIGISGHVYPATGFVEIAKLYGVKRLEINAESTRNSNLFDETRTGPANQVVPTFVDEILAEKR